MKYAEAVVTRSSSATETAPTPTGITEPTGKDTPRDHLPVVLAVDDIPENLTALFDLLGTDHRMRAAKDGLGALRVATSEPIPDLILLDVMMPGLDGHAVLLALKRDPRTREIPVIFVTALDSAEDEEAGLALGAVDYITKPFKPAIVRARVKAHIELKRARDALDARKRSLEDEIVRRLGENRLMEDVGIEALTRLAETRDKETGNHLRRTQSYVRTLARRLKSHPKFADYLTDRTIDLIVKSAPLHDIGKVGIPDRVLLKRGKLDPEEWAVMKTHTHLGTEAIEQAERDTETPIEFLSLAKEITRHHHEHWDGSGYPDGLAGEAIPVSARMMAVADVFDALMCRRSYKEPLPSDEVRRQIAAKRGRQFDPDMVDAFLEAFDEMETIARRFADPTPADDIGTRDLAPPDHSA